MNCCIECFTDQGLRSRIFAESQEIGDCDFCGISTVALIPATALAEIFKPIFELYINYTSEKTSIKQDKSTLIHEHLYLFWPNLFNTNTLKIKDIKHLVNQIGRGLDYFDEKLFEKPVGLLEYLVKDKEEEYNLQWETFAKDIKENNRFFIQSNLDLELLEVTLLRFAKTYPPGQSFYRARISDEKLNPTKLGKPDKDSATPGRANPIGIPYLYLSDKEETTLYETRISLHESITIGKFELKAPLHIISLKNIAQYGPFEILDKGFDLAEFISYRPYLLKLEEELSKPVRKKDVNLDYLPTQYLCEYIKSKGFDGVEYRSAMVKDGYNLAIFNDYKLECLSSNFYIVKDLKYKW